MQTYVDIHKKEATRIASEWASKKYPDVTLKSFRISWFAYIPNGWKCMLAFKQNPGVFYEVTKNIKTGEIYGCQYAQTAYFVKPSNDKAIELSTMHSQEEIYEFA